jgi:hypothetical protein
MESRVCPRKKHQYSRFFYRDKNYFCHLMRGFERKIIFTLEPCDRLEKPEREEVRAAGNIYTWIFGLIIYCMSCISV